MPKITEFNDIIAHVSEHTHRDDEGPHVLLSFSGGKDAWGVWLALQGSGLNIHPFSYYIVPGLEIVDDYLAECERRVGPILRYPHPMLYDMLTSCTMQAPQRIWALEHLGLPRFTKDDLHRCAENDLGFPAKSCYVALGLRAADSIMRGSYFKSHGAVDTKRKVFSPIWDWDKARLVDALRAGGVKLSREYLLFGRTMDGPVLLYSLALKRHAPRDYRTLLEWFPLLESEVWRYERAVENGEVPNAV